jgi:hypothetical protein
VISFFQAARLMVAKNRKREKMITLRINETSYEIIKDFAADHGLSVNAYLNSIIDSQAEWFIPINSYDAVTVPKSLMATLFGMAGKESIDELAKRWAAEAKNIILLSGRELGIESALDFAKRVSKYFMGTDARITAPGNNAVYVVIRHDAGENFSYFISQAFDHLFQNMKIQAFIDHDATTVFVKVENPG